MNDEKKFDVATATKAECLAEATRKLDLALRVEERPKLSEMAFGLACKAELAAYDYGRKE